MSWPPGWSAEAVLEAVITSHRRTWVPVPGLEVIERPGWIQLTNPSFRMGGLNQVAHSVLSAGEADAVIDATIARYRALGLRFRWTVTPDSAPADLADRLAARGLLRTDIRGMARATAGATGDARVEPVHEGNLDAFEAVMAGGWGVDPAPFRPFHRALLADPGHRLFLGREGGVAAGAASYVSRGRAAYLMGGVVLPACRGRGLYRALVGARLADAAARGLALATVQAIEATSAPLLERLGFSTVCRFASFSGAP